MKTDKTVKIESASCVSIEFGVGRFNIKWPAMYFSINGDRPKSEPERMAVINMVKAAPDLLEAAKEADAVLSRFSVANMGPEKARDFNRIVAGLRAAIAKAEGK